MPVGQVFMFYEPHLIEHYVKFLSDKFTNIRDQNYNSWYDAWSDSSAHELMSFKDYVTSETDLLCEIDYENQQLNYMNILVMHRNDTLDIWLELKEPKKMVYITTLTFADN